jgi:DNA-binding transcriptional LysR family regulator
MAVFAKTVETGSFRAAAKALGLSPSVVSHHVSRLEASLDVVLLYRSTRRIALTDDGAKLYDAASAMMVAAGGGVESVTRRAKSPSGKLVVTAPATLARGKLMDDIAAFAREYPRVELVVSVSDVPVDLLRAGIDVAIRAGTLKDSALKAKRLFAMPRTLVAAPSYVATRPRPHAPADLASWDWIRLTSRPSELAFVHANKHVSVKFRARVAADAGDAMLELAVRGLGVVALPTLVTAAALREGRLVEILPEWKLEAPNVYAVWHANAPPSGLAMRFVAWMGRDAIRP